MNVPQVFFLGVLDVVLVASSSLSAQEAKPPTLPAPSNRMTIPQDGIVRCVAFNPDGKTLASGSEDKTIRLWDTATGQPHAVLKGHTSTIYSVAFSPDGKTLASASADETVRLWEAAEEPSAGSGLPPRPGQRQTKETAQSPLTLQTEGR